jgi:chromosome segregation ATPase
MRTACFVLMLGLAGCRSAYYGTMEAFGIPKRDILVDRVEEARDDQQEAKEQFQTALERFQELTGHTGGDLEYLYDKLQDEFEECESEAADVRKRIDSVEDVSDALFDEWEAELKQYSDQDLREQSEKKLAETKARCRELIGVMRKAEKAMKPVLDAFRDRVLFLKHNLNAQAIASLKGHAAVLEGDIRKLVAQMEASIREANEFLDALPES